MYDIRVLRCVLPLSTWCVYDYIQQKCSTYQMTNGFRSILGSILDKS